MLLRASLITLAATSAAHADGLKIVTDIAPIHSLVAHVAGPDAEITVLLPPGTSPHGYAMRPSEARSLQEADLIVWVGSELTPWLDSAIDSLAPNTPQIALLDVEGINALAFREIAVFGGDGEDHAEEGDHKDHDHGDEDHAEDDGHKDHNDHDDHAGHEGHDHSGTDPHAWLDPRNAQALLHELAHVLSDLDPDQAEQYETREDQGKAGLDQLIQDVSATLEPVKSKGFVVYHDAYQYFEAQFGLSAKGAIAASDAQDPGPRRLAEIKEAVADNNVTCAFYEPQFSPGLIAIIAEGTDLKQAEIDPLGAAFDPSSELYGQTLRQMAASIAGCLSGSD